MRLLILASPYDAVAADVATRVRAAGDPVTMVALEDLGRARWDHRLGGGAVATRLTLTDGLAVDAGAHDAVLNRLRYEPTLLFTRMQAEDRAYARAEFHALLLSWLASIDGRMVGRPAPPGLAGPQVGAWQWLQAATAAGFVPYPARATSSARLAPPGAGDQPWAALLPHAFHPALDMLGIDRPRAYAPAAVDGLRLTLIGGQAVEAVDPALAACGARLAKAMGTDILQLELARSAADDRWRFVGAEPMPVVLDPPAIDALVALVRRR